MESGLSKLDKGPYWISRAVALLLVPNRDFENYYRSIKIVNYNWTHKNEIILTERNVMRPYLQSRRFCKNLCIWKEDSAGVQAVVFGIENY